MSDPLHVVIVGGGFAGLDAARALRKEPVRVTLIDRRNHHLFQPLLYQVATAALSPADIAEPIRAVLAKQANAEVMLGNVQDVDLDGKRICVDHTWVSYDRLILATGSWHAYFGHDEWAEHAPGLKTISDALDIRQHMLRAFEQAEWADDPAERRRLMTFVIIGGGPTGVELAGAIAEIAMRTLHRDFRHIRTEDTRIVLVEAAGAVLNAYPEDLRDTALAQLQKMGVDVRLESPVTGVDERGVDLGDTRLDAGTVLWAAGIQASPLARGLDAELDRVGRVKVDPDLSVPGHPDAFVVGDLAHFAWGLEAPLPQVAQVAKQMGAHVAKNLRRDRRGRARKPFRYRDYGNMATIGRSKAVADIRGMHLSGLLAWLAWVFVHIAYLIGFRNRVVVLVKWIWAYVTWDRSSRLIWKDEVHGEGVLAASAESGMDSESRSVQTTGA